MAFTKDRLYTYFTPNLFCFTIFFVCERKYYFFLCMRVKFGSVAPEVLIRHLCEHNTDILFTSAFKMAELYRFYTDHIPLQVYNVEHIPSKYPHQLYI